MTTKPRFLVDSDVFITAKNAYYDFGICPGFWEGVIRQHEKGRVFSVDRVRNELLAGRKDDDLVQWVTNDLPPSFFLDVESGDVPNRYTEIMVWSQRHPAYFDYAKAKFATGADGWLVAYARVHDAIVVTNEARAPDSKSDIKLPDVCAQFGVPVMNTFSMLKELAVRFELAGAK